MAAACGKCDLNFSEPVEGPEVECDGHGESIIVRVLEYYSLKEWEYQVFVHRLNEGEWLPALDCKVKHPYGFYTDWRSGMGQIHEHFEDANEPALQDRTDEWMDAHV